MTIKEKDYLMLVKSKLLFNNINTFEELLKAIRDKEQILVRAEWSNTKKVISNLKKLGYEVQYHKIFIDDLPHPAFYILVKNIDKIQKKQGGKNE